jgi:DNA-binding NarL/FixJ family response regulator/HPt (histidine-containing phosphotransfer) domain-containing protein
MNDMSCIDAGVVQQMFGEDLTLFGSALSLLLRDHAEFNTPMTVLLDEPGARDRLQMRVHALRGSTGLLGATRIMRLAGEAETALEQGRSTDCLAPILGQLTAAFSQLHDEAVLWLARQAEQQAPSNAKVVLSPTTGTDGLDELMRQGMIARASALNTDLQILLVDDHDIVHVGIMSLLERAGNMKVIGSVGTGEAAVVAALRLCPDLIVMDLVLPDLNGIDATRRILTERPQTHIIALSACRTSEHVHRALQAGARGYVVKTSVGLYLIPAIKAVLAGKQYVCPGIVPVEQLGGLPSATRARGRLSAREREVLRLLVAGLSSADIGRQLSLSPKSIDTYRHRIMVKLGVANRAALIRVAIEYDLVTV